MDSRDVEGILRGAQGVCGEVKGVQGMLTSNLYYHEDVDVRFMLLLRRRRQINTIVNTSASDY